MQGVAKAPHHVDQVREETKLLEVFTYTDLIGQALDLVHVIVIDGSNMGVIKKFLYGLQMLLRAPLLILFAPFQRLIPYLDLRSELIRLLFQVLTRSITALLDLVAELAETIDYILAKLGEALVRVGAPLY